MHTDFRAMAAALRELRAQDMFPTIHHFSRPAFASDPPDLDRFVRYCDGVVDFQRGENPQTIRRAFAVIEQLRNGVSLERAIRDAWTAYPLVTR